MAAGQDLTIITVPQLLNSKTHLGGETNQSKSLTHILQVKKVVRSGEQYTVTYTAGEGPVEEVFDSVVLATPLHDAGIKFDLDVTEHMSPYQVNTLCKDEQVCVHFHSD